jgi:hypothetical protein
MNQFEYKINEGAKKGAFNIYQASSGAIMLLMGNRVTALNRNQLSDLQLDLYSLIDFDHDQFITYYSCHANMKKDTTIQIF